MKSPPALRRVQAPEYEQNVAVTRWQRDGHLVCFCQPLSQAPYIAFRAKGSQGIWQGMIAPNEWLDSLWPQRSELLPQGCTDQEILQLFLILERPIDLAQSPLDYEQLIEVELIQKDSRQRPRLPCITTGSGTLWVLSLPSHYQPRGLPVAPWLQRSSHAVRLVLGYSGLSVLQQQKLRADDVLFIAEKNLKITVLDQCIGHYTFIEKGLNMQLDIQGENAVYVPPVISALPVKVEFVLQEITLTVAQLNELVSTQILPVELSALSQIEVRVDGRIIAIGELVQLGDRLGVELREIFRGEADE